MMRRISNLKYKKFLLFLILVISILSVVGLSYAYWYFGGTQKDFNSLGVKCFEISLKEESAAITLNDIMPVTDEEGLKNIGYTFTIKNTCNTYAAYQVNLEEIVPEAKRLSSEYVKVSINDGTPNVLGSLPEAIVTLKEADKSHTLTKGSLAPEEEKTYTLKMWMDYETPAIDEVMNATFLSKVVIEAGYIKEEAIANEIEISVESQTKEINGEEEKFIIEGRSEKYKIIEYSEDNTHWTTIINPEKTFTLEKTYEKEGKYTFYIKDEMGNSKEIEIETSKLDQTPPRISIEIIDKQESIDIKITLTDEKSKNISYAITTEKTEPSKWERYEGEITYTITANETYYIWYKDEYGNQSYEAYSSTTIDKQAPTVRLTNSLREWGSKDEIQIIATDDVIGISGISISKEAGKYNWEVVENTKYYETSKEIEENGTYYVAVKDAYNHIREESIVIDKIDKVNPQIENISVTETWGKENTITGMIKDGESGLAGYQWTREEREPTEYIAVTGESYRIEYEAKENGTYYLWVKDKTNNIYHTSIEVSKVDNTPPVITKIDTYYQILGNVDYKATGYQSDAGLNGTWHTTSGDPIISFGDVSKYKNIRGAYLELESPLANNALVQIFYAEDGDNYSEEHSVQKTLKAGEKSLYFTLPTKNYKSIRFDIGTSTGLSYKIVYMALLADNATFTNGYVLNKVYTTEQESGLKEYYYSYDQKTWYNDFEFSMESDGIKKRFLAERDQNIYFKAIDNAGNESNISSVNVKIDTTAPNISKVDSYYQILGNISHTIYGYQNDAGLNGTWHTISGDPNITFGNVSGYTNIKGAYIELESPLANDTLIQIFYAEAGENFNETNSVKQTLKAGEKSLYFTLPTKNYKSIRFDIGTSTGLSYKITYLALLADNGLFTNGFILNKINATDQKSGLDKFYYSYDQKTWYDDFEFNIEKDGIKKRFASERNQSIYFMVKDKAGNKSNIASVNVKIDTSAPTVSWQVASSVSGTNSWYKSLSLRFNGTDSSSGISSAKYCITTGSSCTPNTGATISNNQFTVNLGSNVNAQKVCATYTDKVGNVSNVTCSTAYKVDSNLPSISFSVASSTAGNNGWYKTLTMRGNLSDSHSGIASAKYCVTTGSSCTPNTNASVSNNSFTVQFGTNSAAQKICGNVTDKAGQTSSTVCSGNYSVDTANPSASISASQSGNSVSVNAYGSSDSGSGIATYYYRNGNGQWYSSSASGFTFSNLADGTYTFSLYVVDKAGRTSSTVSINVTVVNTLYLFNNGSFYGSYNTWAGKSDGRNYFTIGSTINHNDNSTTRYGNSLIGFSQAINMGKYKTLSIQFTVNSISNVSSAHPAIIQAYVVPSGSYRISATADSLRNNSNVVSNRYDVTTTGNYTLNVNVSNISGNYNVIVQAESHQYKNNLFNVDIRQVYLSP